MGHRRARHFYPRSPCGERPAIGRRDRAGRDISIHALLAESDLLGRDDDMTQLEFLSTLSLRRATMAPYEAPTTQAEFLSTLSLRRATEPQNEIIAYDNDFYPRSPCGERPSNINSSSIIAYFYPRSPCGERPASGFLSDTSDVISIHALLAESDEHAYQLVLWVLRFLSTLSLRRATF